MIIKDKAKGWASSSAPSILFEEMCVICEKDIPNGSLVLRKQETGRIICIQCLNEIAEAN